MPTVCQAHLSTSYELVHLILEITFWKRECYFQFTGENGAERVTLCKVTKPGSEGTWNSDLGKLHHALRIPKDGMSTQQSRPATRRTLDTVLSLTF